MLSRVADGLYWMSRYFERAAHCARVLEATHNLMLDPTRISVDQRWMRALSFLGLSDLEERPDPESAIVRLATDNKNRSSIVSCITAARENAGQVREEISAEMWEQLNRLYHEVTRPLQETRDDSQSMALIGTVRDGSYKFHGITEATMNHGQSWNFIQLGRFTERACAVSLLLDAYFSTDAPASDLDWLCLLSSCGAFEAYCKVYTADLKPGSIAEFLLLNTEFPFSVRYSAERMHTALDGITGRFSTKKTETIEKTIGRLLASVSFTDIAEVVGGDLHLYLNRIIDQCRRLHSAVNNIYIEYPIEAVFQI